MCGNKIKLSQTHTMELTEYLSKTFSVGLYLKSERKRGRERGRERERTTQFVPLSLTI